MRRNVPCAIERNGSVKRTYGCLCGDTISMDCRWRRPKRVAEWLREHSSWEHLCGTRIVRTGTGKLRSLPDHIDDNRAND